MSDAIPTLPAYVSLFRESFSMGAGAMPGGVAPMTPEGDPIFDLSPCVQNLINDRDKLWKELAYSGRVNTAAELNVLDAANEIVRLFLSLQSSKRVRLFAPPIAHVELLRVEVCATFIARCRLENRAGRIENQ